MEGLFDTEIGYRRMEGQMIGPALRIESIEEIPGCSSTTSNTIECWYYSAPIDFHINNIGYGCTGDLLENEKLNRLNRSKKRASGRRRNT